MRRHSFAIAATILSIALYFTFVWGFQAVGMLTSPTYGLDDVWRAQFVFAIGGLFHLTPVGLIKLAAFFATLKLAVAGSCALYILDRLRRLRGGTADPGILEAALILVVVISILSVGPAVWSENVALVREGTIQLVLAGIATALCMLERRGERDERGPPRITNDAVRAAPPFRL